MGIFMENKNFIRIIICILLVGAAIILNGCFENWKLINEKYLEYENDYEYFYATVTSTKEYNGENLWRLSVDSEDYLERYKDKKWVNQQLTYYNSGVFRVIEASNNELIRNEFYEALNDNTVITIYTHPYIAWNGWDFPIVGIKIKDKTYLEFEIGKENWLNYIKEKI